MFLRILAGVPQGAILGPILISLIGLICIDNKLLFAPHISEKISADIKCIKET